MESEPLRPASHLFTVRLWLEPLGDGQTEWRGKVQHVTSGEAQYIRDWPALQAFLERRLQPLDVERDTTARLDVL
jgi:hypothetical protein